MTADPERLLGHVVRFGEAGTVISGATLAGYVTIGAALLISGYTIQAYPVLSLAHDPILNGLLAAIGFSITVMSGGLFFLAQLTRGDEMDRSLVILFSSLGVGFGGSVHAAGDDQVCYELMRSGGAEWCIARWLRTVTTTEALTSEGAYDDE